MTQLAMEMDLRMNPHPAVACDTRGSKDNWRKWRQRYPVCNRPAFHTGPHRVYNAKAEILAEWEDE